MQARRPDLRLRSLLLQSSREARHPASKLAKISLFELCFVKIHPHYYCTVFNPSVAFALCNTVCWYMYNPHSLPSLGLGLSRLRLLLLLLLISHSSLSSEEGIVYTFHLFYGHEEIRPAFLGQPHPTCSPTTVYIPPPRRSLKVALTAGGCIYFEPQLLPRRRAPVLPPPPVSVYASSYSLGDQAH